MGLSLEKELDIAAFNLTVDKMSRESLLNTVKQLYQLLVVKEVFYQKLLGQKWGLLDTSNSTEIKGIETEIKGIETEIKDTETEIKDTETEIKDVELDPMLKQQLDALKDDLKLSNQGELIEFLLSQYQQSKASPFEFTPEEENIISEAVQTGITRGELFKIGIMSEAKKRVSMANTFNLTDMPDEILFDPHGMQGGKSLKTVKGIGDERIDRTVKAVMAINDKATKKGHKSCITQGLIFTLCGVNRNTLSKYFSQYQEQIDTHNKKHGLDPNSNRKGNGFNWLVELTYLEYQLGIYPKVITTIARFKNLGNK